MKLNDLYEIAARIAPMEYSSEFCARYGAYDNSGILIDMKNEIEKAVFSLDLTKGAVERAKEIGAGVIVTHHPAIYAKLSKLSVDDPTSSAVLAAMKNGISVISMHLNLDTAEGGIDECLAFGIRIMLPTTNRIAHEGGNEKIMYTFSCGKGGYGRVYDVPELPATYIKEEFDKHFSAKHTLLFAKEGQRVSRIASFCGAGADEESLDFAVKNGADMIVSSDIKHHILKNALSCGLAVLMPTHYAAENYGFYQFYKKIAKEAAIDCEFITEDALL